MSDSLDGRKVTTIVDGLKLFEDRSMEPTVICEISQGVCIELGPFSHLWGAEWVEARLPDGRSGYLYASNARTHTKLRMNWFARARDRFRKKQPQTLGIEYSSRQVSTAANLQTKAASAPKSPYEPGSWQERNLGRATPTTTSGPPAPTAASDADTTSLQRDLERLPVQDRHRWYDRFGSRYGPMGPNFGDQRDFERPRGRSGTNYQEEFDIVGALRAVFACGQESGDIIERSLENGALGSRVTRRSPFCPAASGYPRDRRLRWAIACETVSVSRSRERLAGADLNAAVAGHPISLRRAESHAIQSWSDHAPSGSWPVRVQVDIGSFLRGRFRRSDVFAGGAWPQISTCLRRRCRRVELDRLVGVDGGMIFWIAKECLLVERSRHGRHILGYDVGRRLVLALVPGSAARSGEGGAISDGIREEGL